MGRRVAKDGVELAEVAIAVTSPRWKEPERAELRHLLRARRAARGVLHVPRELVARDQLIAILRDGGGGARSLDGHRRAERRELLGSRLVLAGRRPRL